MTLHEEFIKQADNMPNYTLLVTATRLPSGALETQVNSQELEEKVKYIKEKYDENFALKANPNVQIVGYILL